MPLLSVLYVLTIWCGLVRPPIASAHAVGDPQEKPSPTGTSATAAEAGRFIVSKVDGLRWSSLEEYRFDDNSVGRKKHQYYENVSIDGCEGTLRLSHIVADWDFTDHAWSPAKEIEDAKRTYPFDASTFLIKSSFIRSTSKDGDTERPDNWLIVMHGNPSAVLYMPDRDMAERVFNAFKGLAQACGAKEEPY